MKENSGQFKQGCNNPNKILPILGKKYGDLEIISEEILYSKDGRSVWQMKCECGNTQNILAKTLRRTIKPRVLCSACSRKLAGQLRMEKLGTTKLKGCHSGIGLITKTHYHHFKSSSNPNRRATKSKEIFNGTFPTIEVLWALFEKQKGKCALSGVDLSFGGNLLTVKGQSRINHMLMTASLDRIDNSKGYTNNNIQWLHKHINMMKSNHDQNYFVSLCKLIVKHDNPEPSPTV